MPDLWRLRPGSLEWRLIEGEVVGLDMQRSEYLVVNRSGAVLWPSLAEGASAAELAQRLVERYGVEREVAAVDVAAFLAVLAARQLLET